MLEQEWIEWAMVVHRGTPYGTEEVLSCVELLEKRADEGAIKVLVPFLLRIFGGSGIRIKPSDLLRGFLAAVDFEEAARTVYSALLKGVNFNVPSGTRLTDTNSANRGGVDSPYGEVRRAQEEIDSSESLLHGDHIKGQLNDLKRGD